MRDEEVGGGRGAVNDNVVRVVFSLLLLLLLLFVDGTFQGEPPARPCVCSIYQRRAARFRLCRVHRVTFCLPLC